MYISVLLEMLKNNMLCEPFIHVPPEGPLPRLSKHDLILVIIIIIYKNIINNNKKKISKAMVKNVKKYSYKI